MRVEVYYSFPLNFLFSRTCDRCDYDRRFLGGWRILSGKWEKFACSRCTKFRMDAMRWFHDNYPSSKPEPPPAPPQYPGHVYVPSIDDLGNPPQGGSGVPDTAQIIRLGKDAGKQLKTLREEINSKVEENHKILLELSEKTGGGIMSRAARLEYEKLGPLSEEEKTLARYPIVIRGGKLHLLTPKGAVPLREAYKEVGK